MPINSINNTGVDTGITQAELDQAVADATVDGINAVASAGSVTESGVAATVADDIFTAGETSGVAGITNASSVLALSVQSPPSFVWGDVIGMENVHWTFPTTGRLPDRLFVNTTVGASPGASEPTWNTTLDSITVDGDITWQCKSYSSFTQALDIKDGLGVASDIIGCNMVVASIDGWDPTQNQFNLVMITNNDDEIDLGTFVGWETAEGAYYYWPSIISGAVSALYKRAELRLYEQANGATGWSGNVDIQAACIKEGV